MAIFSPWPICSITPVTPEGGSAAVRRVCQELAELADFSEFDAGRLSLIATELATNLEKHGKEGQIVLQLIDKDYAAGIAVISLDQGPGMYDIDSCITDGFSTAGSPGTGLGAVKRQSDLFDIFSQPGTGSIITAEVYPERKNVSEWSNNVRCICRPLPPEEVSGDAWGYVHRDSFVSFTIIDGLGYGPDASRASGEGLKIFLETDPRTPPAQMIKLMSDNMRRTRGAACGIVNIDLTTNELTFAGLGNINASFTTSDKDYHLVSLPGALGVGEPRIKEFKHPYHPGSLLRMSSDGLQTRQTLPPGFSKSSPMTIAAYLFQKFQRHNDDSTVLIARVWRHDVLPSDR